MRNIPQRHRSVYDPLDAQSTESILRRRGKYTGRNRLEPHPARATFVRWLGGHVRQSTELMKSMRNMRPHAR